MGTPWPRVLDTGCQPDLATRLLDHHTQIPDKPCAPIKPHEFDHQPLPVDLVRPAGLEKSCQCRHRESLAIRLALMPEGRVRPYVYSR